MGKGYIRLYRQVQDCWVWDDKYSRGQAWVDLLLSANHKDVKIPFNGEIRTIKRGQYLTSIRKLAERWKWHRNTVQGFLRLLENDLMIELEVSTNCTMITIVNYDIYQYSEDEDVPPPVPQDVPPSVPPPVPQPSTNNNDINDINENKYNNIPPLYIPPTEEEPPKKKTEKKQFVKPTAEEVEAYCRERNNNIDAEAFIAYYESNGWMVGRYKMKSWKSTVITWEKNEKKRSQGNGNSNSETIIRHPATEYTDEELERFKDLV